MKNINSHCLLVLDKCVVGDRCSLWLVFFRTNSLNVLSTFTKASFVAVDGVSEGQWLKIHSRAWAMAQQRGRGRRTVCHTNLPTWVWNLALPWWKVRTDSQSSSLAPMCMCHGCEYTHIHCIHAKHVHSNNKHKIVSRSYCGWRDGLVGKSTCCTNTASWVWISAPCRMLGMMTLGLDCNSNTAGARDRRDTGTFWLSTLLEVQWELPVE